MEVTVRAPAKINLTLDAVGRRDDGYHLIESVMQAVDLFDIVTGPGEPGEPGIRLETDDERVPDDESNTAWRAAQAFFEIAGLPPEGVEIRIRKRIPLQAGLAGRSADAAGVLTALNLLTDSRLEGSILAEAGERVGADVPFCLTGGAALCTGTGAIVSPLPSMPGLLAGGGQAGLRRLYGGGLPPLGFNGAAPPSPHLGGRGCGVRGGFGDDRPGTV